MPTEAEFEQARARFENAAEDVEQLIVPVRRANGPDVLTGGRLTADIDAFIDTTGDEFAAMAGELRELATESARRAEEARQALAALQAYAEDYQAYRQADAEYRQQARTSAAADGTVAVDLGPRPTPPTRPPDPPSYIDLDLSVGGAFALLG